MPRINRIRVNNIKYNFGTQYYDDFMLRFSGKNSLYDLANGGGKSVLMLLLLQNLIPNCTLDDKQPVEKLFRTGNGNTTIHSLVEWKLDSSDVKNGYKYMLTGFCARKAKESEEQVKSIETANVDYFNYCIFYREFGENDIKNLPLSKGRERVNYNGLKAYLRDLEKKDYGVEVHIFDRKGDYQNFISNYGLYESQWEIVRGINKTEGHVRTYFESNYKTTRKVIEDLLIEGIIEKSYNNRIRKGEEDDLQMAKTLLDIKDKLIDLSKRKSEINNYDEQIKLLKDFSAGLLEFRDIFLKKAKLQESLTAYLLGCRKRLVTEREKSALLEQQLQENSERINDINRDISAAEIETELKELDKIEELINETKLTKAGYLKDRERLQEEMRYKEAAADYIEYENNRAAYEELKEIINNTARDKSELLSELKKLAATKKHMLDALMEELSPKLKECREKLSGDTAALEKARADKLEIYGQINRQQGMLEELNKQSKEYNEVLNSLLTENNLLSLAGIYEDIKSTEERIKKSRADIEELSAILSANREELVAARQKIAEYDSELSHTAGEIENCDSELLEAKRLEEQLNSIKKVYGEINGEALVSKIEGLLRSLSAEIIREEDSILRLRSYENALNQRTVPDYGKHFKELENYFKLHYEDVKTGREILAECRAEKKMEYLTRFPQMVYSFFAKESYEKIKQDSNIKRLNTGSYIIPVFDYSILEAEEGPYDKLVVAFRDPAFILDEARARTELEKTAEELAKTSEGLAKLRDRYEVMEKDLYDSRYIITRAGTENIRKRYEELVKNKEQLLAAREKSLLETEAINERINGLTSNLEKERRLLEALSEKQSGFAVIKDTNDRLNEIYERSRTGENELKEANKKHSELSRKVRFLEEETDRNQKSYNAYVGRLDARTRDYEEKFKIYYEDNIKGYDELSEEEADSRAEALRKIFTEEMGELADKEKLLAGYESAMKKCLDNLKYLSVTLEEAKKAKENGVLTGEALEERIRIKKRLEELNKCIEKTDETINSEQAHRSRIEGSIWHGKKLYEEKYGEFVREMPADPGSLITAKRNELEGLVAIQKQKNKELKMLEESYRDITLMEKDLARIMKNAGIVIREDMILSEEVYASYGIYETKELNEKAYEAVLYEYEKICREEQKRRGGFLDEKQRLRDRLNELNAFELATEIGISLVPPENTAEIDIMVNGFAETNECIALERDSIEQGIKDMEMIKANFEERCIQICSNIKTELERLPKLSRINLDEEVISMITLAIPYIKEELYRDRMSVYINETVSCAETIANAEDKLKYIKNQLSWKKLFSVIVTDMNSIKLCLYKREHIKDQSRYLRYEEAVGSTGQSQGIYIQFLIAIIHYISNINSAVKDNGIVSKTIFIDNPFGAAKDVYIWEPIFKLLKTNHVQLIVPARGATPGITKMFDINYILGQKMVGERQQTVVVDYRSQTNTEELDYQIMEFEQTTLNFD